MDRDNVQIVEHYKTDLKAAECSTNVVGTLFLFRKKDHALLLQTFLNFLTLYYIAPD